MGFDLNKLRTSKRTKKISHNSLEVTVTEIPLLLLFRFKKLKGAVASAIARFTQINDVAASTIKTENVPIGDDKEDAVISTDTHTREKPDKQLIDQKVNNRTAAISSLADVLLDEEFVYDVMVSCVVDFKDMTKEQMLDVDGLSLPALLKIALGIVEVNMSDFESLGNYLSRLKVTSSDGQTSQPEDESTQPKKS